MWSIGVADKKAVFVTLVANVSLEETKARRFFFGFQYVDATYISHQCRNSRSGVFVSTTMTTTTTTTIDMTDYFTPAAHARGVNMHDIIDTVLLLCWISSTCHRWYSEYGGNAS